MNSEDIYRFFFDFWDLSSTIDKASYPDEYQGSELLNMVVKRDSGVTGSSVDHL